MLSLPGSLLQFARATSTLSPGPLSKFARVTSTLSAGHFQTSPGPHSHACARTTFTSNRSISVTAIVPMLTAEAPADEPLQITATACGTAHYGGCSSPGSLSHFHPTTLTGDGPIRPRSTLRTVELQRTSDCHGSGSQLTGKGDSPGPPLNAAWFAAIARYGHSDLPP